MHSETNVPNPGSNEAIKMGCSCPIVDNARGAGLPDAHGTIAFWISEDCPVHWDKNDDSRT